MENYTRWNSFRTWDPWPLTRLLLVLAALGLCAHWRFGWTWPTPLGAAKAAFGLFELGCLFGLIGLGPLYMMAVALPIYATVLFNEWFYEASYWVLGLAGPRSPHWRAGFALAGELGLFLGLGRALELLLKHGF